MGYRCRWRSCGSRLSGYGHLVEKFGDDYAAAKVSANPAAVGPVTAIHDDPWAILYTSGTTGHPKGAICTHGMFFWNAINIGHAVGLTSKSTNLNVLPTFHSGGLNLYTTPCLHLGARSINLAEFDPDKVLAYLEESDRVDADV